MNEWQKLSFSVPIKEGKQTKEGKGIVIEGIAIEQTTSRNGVTYTAEELKPAAPSLENKPLLKDHNNSVDSVVGKVIESRFEESSNSIKFKAKVLDEGMKEKIKEGLITNVSVGAMVEDIREVENEETEQLERVALGIEFVELSLTPVPGIPGASFAVAAEEAFNLKNESDNTHKNKITEDKLMAEKEKTQLEKLREEKTQLEKLREEKEALQVELEQIAIEKLKQQKEEAEAELEPEETKEEEEKEEEPAEPPKDETEGEVAAEEKEEETVSSYKLEKADYGYALSTDYNSVEGLKNLRRD